MAIQPNPVVDLRGSPTGLEGLDAALTKLIESIKYDPNDRLRNLITTDLQAGAQIAREGYNQYEAVRASGGDPETADLGVNKIVNNTVVREAMKLYPETQREVQVRRGAEEQVGVPEQVSAATRPIREGTAMEDALPLSEKAAIEADKARAEGATARLTKWTAEDELAVHKRAQELGFTPEAQAAVQVLGLRIQNASQMLTAGALENFNTLWDASTPEERKIIFTGLLGPQGALFGQYLLGQQEFQWNYALRSLADAKTQFEADKAQFEAVAAVRQERDRLIAQARKLMEDKPEGWRDQLETIGNDINDAAARMLRLDPQSFVTTMTLERGLGGRPTGFTFNPGNIITAANGNDPSRSNADLIETWAFQYNKLGADNNAQRQLQEALRDPLTGRLNDVLWGAVMQRAADLREGRNLPEQERSQAALLARGYMNGRGNPDEIRQKVERLQLQLAEMISLPSGQAASPQTIVALQSQIRVWQMVQTLASPVIEVAPVTPTPRGQEQPLELPTPPQNLPIPRTERGPGRGGS